MKVIYILAIASDTPIAADELVESLETDDVEVEVESEHHIRLVSDGTVVELLFERITKALGWTPDLVAGTEAARKALAEAKGVYRISVEPGGAQPSVRVFEALWCARALLGHSPGVLLDVTSFKLHEPADVEEITELEFDVRDHVNLHAVELFEGAQNLWIHSHGMAKFGARDIELFQLSEEDIPAAEQFLHQLCTDLAFGQGPKERSLIETGEGDGFMLVPSEEARPRLPGLAEEDFDGHEAGYDTLVSPSGRHTVSEVLKPYRAHFLQESPEQTEAFLEQAKEYLPAFKGRFQRRGLMDPLQFLVRATFETHPAHQPSEENLWLEVLTWENDAIVGRLLDGSAQTTEWRKGSQVEIDESLINAVALRKEGAAFDNGALRQLLSTERPS